MRKEEIRYHLTRKRNRLKNNPSDSSLLSLFFQDSNKIWDLIQTGNIEPEIAKFFKLKGSKLYRLRVLYWQDHEIFNRMLDDLILEFEKETNPPKYSKQKSQNSDLAEKRNGLSGSEKGIIYLKSQNKPTPQPSLMKCPICGGNLHHLADYTVCTSYSPYKSKDRPENKDNEFIVPDNYCEKCGIHFTIVHGANFCVRINRHQFWNLVSNKYRSKAIKKYKNLSQKEKKELNFDHQEFIERVSHKDNNNLDHILFITFGEKHMHAIPGLLNAEQGVIVDNSSGLRIPVRRIDDNPNRLYIKASDFERQKKYLSSVRSDSVKYYCVSKSKEPEVTNKELASPLAESTEVKRVAHSLNCEPLGEQMGIRYNGKKIRCYLYDERKINVYPGLRNAETKWILFSSKKKWIPYRFVRGKSVPFISCQTYIHRYKYLDPENPAEIDNYLKSFQNNLNNHFHEPEIQNGDHEMAKELKDTAVRKNSREIGIHDFIVRKNGFNCIYGKHHVENITAVVNVIRPDNSVMPYKIAAAYCPQCKVYYIMESSYQMLKLKGIIACRVTDEKSYRDQKSSCNGMNLAKESILMEYGYNVSRENGLSSRQRQMILEMLVDNHIISAANIVGYLDFFIKQRSAMRTNKYDEAIEKWKADRDYISHYTKKNKRSVNVVGIKRKY